MVDEAPEEATTEGWSVRTWLTVMGAMTALIVLVTVAMVVVAGGGRHDPQHAAAMPATEEVAPLELWTVPGDVAAHYRYAKAHLTEFAQIPCWCGCEQFLGHRFLADCFVRADGAGWEAHAAGCAVCNTEAVIAQTTLDRGGTAAEVKATVDAQFGPTAITTPPPTT